MQKALAGPEYAIAIVVYLVIMLVVGMVAGKKAKADKDGFLLAGRQLPIIVLVGTLLATWFGGGTVVGGANFVYKMGPWAGIFFFIGAPAGAIVLMSLAPKIRELSKYTVPEILERTYGSKTRLLASICVLLAYTGIVSYNFTGAAYIVNLVTGFDQSYSVIIAAFIMVFLAVTAGMNSVAWTDALSAGLIFFGMGCGLYFAVSSAGGYSSAYAALTPAQSSVTGGLTLTQLAGYSLPLFFLYMGDQNQLQRYGCAKTPAEARKSAQMLFCGMLVVIFMVISYCLCAIKLLPGIPGDTAIMRMAIDYVPYIFGAPILCACVAFLVTTGDSFILSASTNIMIDIVQKYFKPDMTDAQLVKGTRYTIIGVGIFSYVMAVYLPEVLAMQMYSYSIYGAGVTIPLLGAFLWKKVSPAGGMASVITGGAAILLWDMFLKRPYGLNGIVVAVPLAVAALIVFSLMVPGKPQTEEA
ncbi:sodium:solute symporter family protein [Synergistaceae bacterium OttesenSCG-928-D05]|nr:sodium:solute symporter family protein [Synergistaceae bacterium OttesenSCG-928-D05]